MDIPIFNSRNLLDLTMRLRIAIVTGGSIGLDRYIDRKAWVLHSLTIVPTALPDRTDINHDQLWPLAAVGGLELKLTFCKLTQAIPLEKKIEPRS